MNDFDENTTADEVLADKNLTGRTVLITGGYSGLGQETARAMAARGAHVIIAGRDTDKLRETQSKLANETGATIDTLECDLASLESVRKAADEAIERFEKIDLLINNAGVMACDFAHTKDGFERQFGVNHLGHFVLTNRLLPLLEKGERVRIVNLSSRGHHIAPVDFDDPISKTANTTNGAATGNRRPLTSCSPWLWRSGCRDAAFTPTPSIPAASKPISGVT